MYQLTDQVYVFPFYMGFMNIYLIDTPDGLLLVDCGVSAKQMQQVLQTLPKLNRSERDLRHIFITHAHFDHVGGLGFLEKQLPFSVRVYAHRREAMIIRGEALPIYARPEDLTGMYRLIANRMKPTLFIPARVDSEVKAGDKIAGLLEVIELPGHAYGHCGLWWAEKRILFGGDALAHFPWGLSAPFVSATPDMPAAKDSIRKIAGMNVDTLCICHGAPVKNAAPIIQQFAERL